MRSEKHPTTSFRLRFVAKQRTIEIATNGWSDIVLPKQPKAKRSTLLQGADKHYDAATLLITNALKELQAARHGIEVKIHHDARMAEKRIMRRDVPGACLSMRKVMTAQFEYVHVIKRIAAIMALHYNLENSFAKATGVEHSINKILSIRESYRPIDFDDDLALDRLENGYFFPILDTETGTITFTPSYDYASSLEVE